MAPPWVTAKKQIDSIDWTKKPAPAHLTAPSFACATISAVNFGPTRLFASIAKCNALSTANPNVLTAQQLAAEAALKYFVDEVGNKFSILNDASTLGDAKFSSIAHDVGAGVANIYMSSLGFPWIGHANEHLPATGKRPDYVYDRGYSEIAILEAKGSIGRTVSKSAMKKRVDVAYATQVEHWLGRTTISGSKITSGYAIGTLARIGRSDASIAVAETDWLKATPSITAASGPSTPIALSNYSAVFKLIGAPAIFWQINRHSVPESEVGFGSEALLEFEHRGRKYLTGEKLSDFDRMHRIVRSTNSKFAIDLNIAESFISFLNKEMPERLPIEPLSHKYEEGEGVAIFDDGLALFESLPTPTGRWIWTVNIGLQRVAG